jgi:hypothetical protein
VAEDFPCGFCGRSSLNGACSIRIQGGKPVSTCPQAYPFVIKRAQAVRPKKPSTNVPIRCIFCEQDKTFWKYDIRRHLLTRHPSWEIQTGKHIDEFKTLITITEEEEQGVGIPDNRIGSMAVLLRLVSDDRRERILPSTRDKHGDSPRRSSTYVVPPRDSDTPTFIPLLFPLTGQQVYSLHPASGAVFN